MRKAALSAFLLALLIAQTASAAAYPVTITFGRSWPYSIVVDSVRGLAYVDAGSGDYPPTGFLFGVINVTSHSVVATLPLNEVPGKMVLDETTGNVYVAGNYSFEVFRGTAVVGTIKTGGHQILGVAHDGSVSRDIFFTSGDNVFALDPGTAKLAGNATVANGPYGLALDPTNGLLYVSEYLSGEIAVLRSSDLVEVATIRLDSCCASQLAIDQRTQTLYASTGTNVVDIVNAAAEKFERSIQVAPSAQNSTNSIVVDNATGRVYVASSPGGTILEVDGSSGSVLRHFLVQSQVAGLALDTKTRELYATNYHQITVFDTARAREFILLIGIAGAAAVAVALIAYIYLGRRERMRVRPRGPTDAFRGES